MNTESYCINVNVLYPVSVMFDPNLDLIVCVFLIMFCGAILKIIEKL